MAKKLSKKRRWNKSPASPPTSDPIIGKLMADAFEKVGKDGVITVEEGKTSDTTLDIVEHTRSTRAIFRYFITNPTEMKAELEDALILCVSRLSMRDACAAREGRPGRQSAAHHRGRRR
ncbi:MAG: hypothetical protein U0744_14150 [Gemmataceae bacterium]